MQCNAMQCNHQIIPKEGKPDVKERVKLKKGRGSGTWNWISNRFSNQIEIRMETLFD